MRKLTLNFPTGWEVEVLGPKDAPVLSDTQIEQAFAEPIGTPRISELAKGKKSAAIVVDDLSRPTPAAKVIPVLLRELASAGVPKSAIRFVVGGGSHRPLTDEEVAKKIGATVAAEYEATSHDFMSGDLRALGNLSNGMPIYLNRVIADADFKNLSWWYLSARLRRFRWRREIGRAGNRRFRHNVLFPYVFTRTRTRRY